MHTDIDECAENNGGCDEHATCNNMPGSFNCTCNPGYTGDGFNCTGMTYRQILCQTMIFLLHTFHSGKQKFFQQILGLLHFFTSDNTIRAWQFDQIAVTAADLNAVTPARKPPVQVRWRHYACTWLCGRATPTLTPRSWATLRPGLEYTTLR